MTYSIKEVFYSLQGEGARAGRPAIFCRFTGCNLWSGLEEHRSQAICKFCDTDFVGTNGDGGGKFKHSEALAQHVASYWPQNINETSRPYVVCTGGEPLLQLDTALIDAFHALDMEVAIETNGTLPVPEGIDWVCVSPKSGAKVVVDTGDELKLVYPQVGHKPSDFSHYQFDHFFLQPLFEEGADTYLEPTITYCLNHPRWHLSLQTHKLLGLK